ncbi:TIGR01244 family sulfur transferase [Phenylobacterium soli]|uniref:TIGR01244 family phosphatase n=1 Tax=Phenylobacterium soli TaxID=2170551 RepID=A0A328AJ30_9CAUL|nr:TIGR01244 family sulfur transferase [Phenylobacterium soli]RAK54445.1 TIGR01244 family phosphatase [Phenylobacterium soli]
MTDFRRVTDDISVSPQIAVADVEAAAAAGFKTIINNRPDGEDPSQPSGHEIEAAARAAGLAYFHVPVRGGPTPEQVETMGRIFAEAQHPVLAFCRSGTRSIVTWSLSQALSGGHSRDELIALGHGAGYDLSGPLGG